MPTIKSAKKRMELSRKWREWNRAKRSRLRTAMKRVREAQDAETARERLSRAYQLLDRAATRHLMHPNKVNRLKGQLAGHVEGLEG